MITVRESAWNQGFPIYMKFHGKVEEKHKQIGNAAPPPLAREIGFSIRLTVIEGLRRQEQGGEEPKGIQNWENHSDPLSEQNQNESSDNENSQLDAREMEKSESPEGEEPVEDN